MCIQLENNALFTLIVILIKNLLMDCGHIIFSDIIRTSWSIVDGNCSVEESVFIFSCFLYKGFQ